MQIYFLYDILFIFYYFLSLSKKNYLILNMFNHFNNDIK